ncbi:MAG TPA: hypothetical protein VFF60_11035 [Candidatus Binatus sp.]|nr:hypothetical protein [Candidatus Binatus sp.]
MYALFAHTSGWLVLVIFMVVPALIAVSLHAVFRRFVPPEALLPHQEVAGFLVAIVGVLYAVVLGFLVISVWSGFDLAQRNADAETTSIANILFISSGMPEDVRKRQRVLLGNYVFEVLRVEWPMLADVQEDPRARGMMVAALHEMANARFDTRDQAEMMRLSTLRSAALAAYRDLATQRRQRILDSEAHVQPTMYFAIAAGGLIVIAFVFLFGVQNWRLQLVMTALVTAMIGLQIGIVFEMDRPFWGAIHVSSDAWSLLIHDNRLGSEAR